MNNNLRTIAPPPGQPDMALLCDLRDLEDILPMRSSHPNSLIHSARRSLKPRLLTAAALTALVAAALMAPPAFGHAAHASYVSSDPAANAVVKSAPSAVTITFAEPVTPAGSAVTIYDAKGAVVSGAAQIEQNDAATMRIPMTGNDSEVYLVVWHTVSATDGDPDVGAFSFFVNANGTSELAPKTTTTITQTPAGVSTWLVALIAVIALLIGLAGGFAWARGSASRASSGVKQE